jgi:hypothetical protein
MYCTYEYVREITMLEYVYVSRMHEKWREREREKEREREHEKGQDNVWKKDRE